MEKVNTDDVIPVSAARRIMFEILDSYAARVERLVVWAVLVGFAVGFTLNEVLHRLRD